MTPQYQTSEKKTLDGSNKRAVKDIHSKLVYEPIDAKWAARQLISRGSVQLMDKTINPTNNLILMKDYIDKGQPWGKVRRLIDDRYLRQSSACFRLNMGPGVVLPLSKPWKLLSKLSLYMSIHWHLEIYLRRAWATSMRMLSDRITVRLVKR